MTELDSREAWRRYASVGALEARLLREPVLRAWERAHVQGASPHQLKAERLSEADRVRLLAAESGFISAARPYMEALSRAAGGERHAAMLGDAHAVVLEVVGDEASVAGPEAVPGPGALLSEAVSGANGIGTPLAEGAYAELVGAEHFIGGFHPFTCQGLPVRGADGEVEGSLSVSVRSPQAAGRLRDILVCAAHGIEAELLRARLEADIQRLLAEDRAGEAGGSDALENLRQDVLQLHTASRLRLQSAASMSARSRFEQALRLVAVAQDTAREFQRRARLFLELAGSDVSPARPLVLCEKVEQLVALLGKEAEMRRVQVVLERLDPCTVEADPRRLSRSLLHLLLRAFDVAQGGGVVRVAVGPWGGVGRVVLRVAGATGRGHPDTELSAEWPLRGGGV
jgi:transcriptional regulator of acetoin/glycerol metabolism